MFGRRAAGDGGRAAVFRELLLSLVSPCCAGYGVSADIYVIFIFTYVLHAFEKASRKTSRHDLEVARRRYRNLMAERARR